MTMASPAPAANPELDERPVFRCHHLSRVYGTGSRSVVALHGIDCAVQPGDRIAVIGPSGSGKSTLLHLMAGLDTPTDGELSWPGLGGDPASRRELVGVVFQAPSLLDPLDVVENVELPLLLQGMDPVAARQRGTQALDELGLGDLANRLPEELSGGQSQRVAAARVLAGRAQLILADEPTGQLDRRTAERVISALLAAADRLQAALVVATHDPVVAQRMTQRWSMVEGRLVTPTQGRQS
jgi:putative ABC transport system ATP-binding protein